MLQITKESSVIRCVDEWFRFAPPKRGERHWKDGRSAKELARAWFPESGGPRIPAELASLFESHGATQCVEWERAEPERVIAFDRCGGERRNADLVLWGRKDGRTILASVEAKADESFGEISGEYVDGCAERNPASRVPERFSLLCEGILGTGPENDEARRCPYQLLTAVAGALCDAEGADAETAVFVVHEFIGATDEAKMRVNSAALNHFIQLISNGAFQSVPDGRLVGPLSIPGNEFFCGTDSLFIGKCRRIVV